MGNIKIIKGVFDSSLELVHAEVAAGFPDITLNYAHETLDFNRDYIKHPEASFYGDVQGDSMKDAGIFDGDRVIKTAVGTGIWVKQPSYPSTCPSDYRGKAERVRALPSVSCFDRRSNIVNPTQKEAQTLVHSKDLITLSLWYSSTITYTLLRHAGTRVNIRLFLERTKGGRIVFSPHQTINHQLFITDYDNEQNH